jgi:hypothetical protein
MRGDHIKVWRNAYWHHGIDVGHGQVIHLAEGESSSRFMRFLSKKSGEVVKTSMEDFLKGGRMVKGGIRNTADPLEKEEIAERAESVVGDPSKYNVLFNNCEHFANWCETGVAKSHQVADVAKKIGYGAGALAVGLVARKFGVKVMPKLKEDRTRFKAFVVERGDSREI